MKHVFRSISVAALMAPGALPVLAQGASLQTPRGGSTTTPSLADVTITGTRERAYRAVVAPTANKSDTLVKETPFSIQTVTRELIEDRGVTSFGEAVRTVPGLTPQVGWGGTNDRFRLRGFATSANLKNGFRRSVFAPVDELANIEQIEVLKGPASALYGRFEPGGVVNLVTRKPLDKPHTQLDFTVGSDSFRRAKFDSTGPVSDSLSYRLTGSWQDNGSFRDFVGNDTQFISPVFRWQVSPDTSITAELEIGRKKASFDRGFASSPLFLNVPISRNYAEPDTRVTNKSALGSIIIDHRMESGWQLRAGLQASSAQTDALWYPYGFSPITGAATPAPIVNRRKQFNHDDQVDTSVMAEVSRRFTWGGMGHRVLMGADANRDKWDYFSDANIGPFGFPVNLPISLYNPVYGTVASPLSRYDSSNYSSRSVGLYAQDEIAINPQWRLLLGARYDKSRSMARADYLVVPGAIRRTDDAVSPRAGITWTPTSAVSLYASWAKSFLTEPSGGLQRSGSLPAPSRGRQIEVGAKFSLIDGRLEPTVSLFDIRRTNGVVSDPADFDYVIQVGEQKSRGIEIDIPYSVTPQWRLLASFTQMKAEISEDSDNSLAGNLLANAPRRSASFWSTYDFGAAAPGWSAGLGAIYVGERQANTANTFVLPAYTRLDANVAWRFGPAQRYKLQLAVQNLADKRYYDSGGSFVPTYPGAPRSVLATLSVALR